MNILQLRTARRLLASLLAVGSLAAAGAEAQAGEITVTEVQLATQLENGVAVAPATSFATTDGRIFAVIRLQNPSRQATTIRVSIEPMDGPARTGMSLDVPAQPRYRTVARMSSNRPAGRYRCVVRTEDGRELASVELTVTA